MYVRSQWPSPSLSLFFPRVCMSLVACNLFLNSHVKFKIFVLKPLMAQTFWPHTRSVLNHWTLIRKCEQGNRRMFSASSLALNWGHLKPFIIRVFELDSDEYILSTNDLNSWHFVCFILHLTLEKFTLPKIHESLAYIFIYMEKMEVGIWKFTLIKKVSLICGKIGFLSRFKMETQSRKPR